MNFTKRHASRAILVVCVLSTATPAPAATASTDDRDPAEDLIAALGRSSDLRLRIMSSTIDVVVDDGDLTNGIRTEETIPAADLVEQARGSTDPLVLDLMVARCAKASKLDDGCDRVAFAARWTEADTQNQAAWLTLAGVLRQRGDENGARAAFLRAAQASRWHDHYFDLARVVVDHAPDGLAPRPFHALMSYALSRAGAFGIPQTSYSTLGSYCTQAGELRAACARIVATMARDTDTLMGLTLSAPYAARAHVDPLVVAGYRMESDAIHWSIQQLVVDDFRAGDASTMDEESLRKENEQLRVRIELGERRVAAEALMSNHVSSGEAAARYVATLNSYQRQARIANLASP